MKTLLAIIETARPKQWTKNLVVLAAFFFALGDKTQSVSLLLAWLAIAAAITFSVVSSGVYFINDIKDSARDLQHPIKKFRPIPSGRLSLPLAWFFGIVFIAAGAFLSFLLNKHFFIVILVYVVLQMFYTFWWKHIALLDVFIIAAGFVLRAVGGGFVVNVVISPWLIVCTFLMALFLALCKRRHELRWMNEVGDNASRPSLIDNSEALFDQLISITAGATIVSYAVYTLWPDTVAKYSTHLMSLTIPFVVYGVFRYLHLVYCKELGDQPESILLTDKPLIVNILLFGLAAILFTHIHL
jgi:4-hydroxybenzoate polyprenyltransferase